MTPIGIEANPGRDATTRISSEPTNLSNSSSTQMSMASGPSASMSDFSGLSSDMTRSESSIFSTPPEPTFYNQIEEEYKGHNPVAQSRPVLMGGVGTSHASSGTHSISGSRRNLSKLPTHILRSIFCLSTAGSYLSRVTLPLVCRRFHNLVTSNSEESGCPEMWDTFEILTGNAGALTKWKQVEYIVAKAGTRRLKLGLTISSSRIGSWEGEVDSTQFNDGIVDEANIQNYGGDPDDIYDMGFAPISLKEVMIQMIRLCARLMPRVEELRLDVHEDDGGLDTEVERVMLELFDVTNTTHLRSLSLIGSYQLEHLLRVTTPLAFSHPVDRTHVQDIFPNLRHLVIGYSSPFSSIIPDELPQILDLEISEVEIDILHDPNALELFLLKFPNLVTLQINGVSLNGSPKEGHLAHVEESSDTIVTLGSLKKLTLTTLPLTLPLLSSLRVPKCQEVILKDLDLGFDQRDIKFRMGLPPAEEHGPSDKAPNPATSTSTPSNPPSRRGLNAKLQSLPFAKFLSSNMHWGTLNSVTMEKIPDMAARMCVDFVRAVSVIHPQQPEGRGLEDLRLMDFSWSDWKWILDDGVSGADDQPPQGAGISLPTLRHLSVAIEYRYESEATRSNSSKEMVNNSGAAREWTNERNQWMAGLTDFAKKRMSRVAVFRMLQQWNIDVPLWLVDDKGIDVSWKQRSLLGQGNTCESRRDSESRNVSTGSIEATGPEDPNRTVLNISLDSGYVDSYAFVHAAWMAIQEEEVHEAS
ncbi:hypothetical protein CPB86DRAFT_790428 [Serendipita vermifera]|nr:hypothetical protein CPB86DRAFT_790428 [Serendipita vermifera]